jgi:hypothetical protein
VVPGTFRAVRASQQVRPNNVLSFYVIVLLVIEGACALALGFLGGREPLHYLVPYVLGFAAISFLGILVTVIVLTVKFPEKLMLGEVSGTEYVEIQQATLGDSRSGEFMATLPITKVAGFSETIEVPLGPSDPEDAQLDPGDETLE